MLFHWLHLVVLISYLSSSKALECMTCEWSKSIDECDALGYMSVCSSNQESCATTVRRYKDSVLVRKNCKNQESCRSNQLQNSRHSGRSTQCNSDQPNSVCTCCCNGNKCNVGGLTCTRNVREIEYAERDCPVISSTLPHGNMKCNNNNKYGSACEYQCTGKDYSLWPEGRKSNICLGNGSWSHEKPCCARPCPPYQLVDVAMVINYSGGNAQRQLKATLDSVLHFGVVAEDAVKYSLLYYSEDPIESSLIKFNEYGENKTRLLQLVSERVKISNIGNVNTGKAIVYALEKMLTPESGMRDNRVGKSLSIYLNTNPDDEVKGPADEARKRGFQVYVFGFENEGFKFDRQKLLDIAGEESHIFVYGNDFSEITEAQIQDLNDHFCSNPCDHVLHDHE